MIEDPMFEYARSIVERRTIVQHLRRTKNLNRPATLTVRQWLKTCNHFNWNCAYCQNNFYQVLEHFISLRCGGGTTYNNCVPACQSCNVLKDMSPHKIQQNIENVRKYLEKCNVEVEA